MSKLADLWRATQLRTRITGLIIIILSLGLIASGTGVFALLNNYLLDATDRRVSRSIGQVTPNSVDVEQNSAATPFVVAHYGNSGALIQANPPWQRSQPNLSPGIITQVSETHFQLVTVTGASGERFRIAVRALPDNTIIALGESLTSINELLGRLLTLFCLFGLAVVVGGGLLTRLLLISAFAPLRRVEETAAAIAAGDFGQRLTQMTENTEVGRLNRSLNRMLNRIDGALADRSRTIDQMRRFISDASHELRTPLVSVRGYAELYRMGAIQSPEDVASAMDRIEREAIRLSTLVSDMLTLARLDEGISKPRTRVNLLALADDAAMDARAQAPNRKITVSAAVPEMGAVIIRSGENFDEEAMTTSRLRFRKNRRNTVAVSAPTVPAVGVQQPIIFAEEDRIRQLLTNLVGNAIRYTPDDTPLEIAAYVLPNGTEVNLDVIDHGEGIPPQAKQKIFERFWRAETSRGRDTGGSGLGLAIVSAIVASHGGKIGLAETPGGGATFRVTFPVADIAEPSQPSSI